MKSDYSIKIISKNEASEILLTYHYLKDISKGFKSGVNYGLICNDKIVGVCIFTGFPVPELVKGMYGLDRSDQDGFFELSRLCIEPITQGVEHNISSWFVSKCVKDLKKNQNVRSILSYADNDHHSGTVYKASNFVYYGLSAKKKDFWIGNGDGTYTKHSRGKTKGIKGEWRDRSQKHRFVLQYDKKLKMLWERQSI